MLDWAFRLVGEKYKREIKELVHVEDGWQFSAAHASANKIEGFKMVNVSQEHVDITDLPSIVVSPA